MSDNHALDVADVKIGFAVGVACSIQNTSDAPVWFFDPAPPFLSLDEGNVINLIYAWIPVPDDFDVESADQPPASKLDPGKLAKRLAFIPLPAADDLPYPTSIETEIPRPDHSRIVRVSVGSVCPASPPMSIVTYCRDKEVKSIDVPFSSQDVCLSKPLSMDVPVSVCEWKKPILQPGTRRAISAAADASVYVQVSATIHNKLNAPVYVALPSLPVSTRLRGGNLEIDCTVSPIEPDATTKKKLLVVQVIPPGKAETVQANIPLSDSNLKLIRGIGLPHQQAELATTASLSLNMGYWEEADLQSAWVVQLEDGSMALKEEAAPLMRQIPFLASGLRATWPRER